MRLDIETGLVDVEQRKISFEYFAKPDQTIEDQRNQLIDQILEKFSLSDEQLHRVMKIMLSEMEKGLRTAVNNNLDKSTLKMLPSYVSTLPSGNEVGNYLALDLGGTNFRVLLISLEEGRKYEMKSKIYHVPHDLMIGNGHCLFDHIAACLSQFTHEVGLVGEKLPLGFTFSFPCSQHGLTSGDLINWTKGFKCCDVEGEDVVRLLQEAVHRRGDVEIDVVALLNDTVGTLMALAHADPDCRIGVIVGTGTNACYTEKLSRCPWWNEDEPAEEMIINTEWGAFGDNGQLNFLRNDFDRVVDDYSINPGSQMFEKMISGMYMGEIVRLVLVDLHNKGLIFAKDDNVELLHKSNHFPTKYVSEIILDRSSDELTVDRCSEIANELGVENVTNEDCEIMMKVCSAVSERAAFLCAAGVAVLLNRMQKHHVTVGMDGSVYRFHPTFKDLLTAKIATLIDSHLKFSLQLSEDGSGRGAALVAAVVSTEKRSRGAKHS